MFNDIFWRLTAPRNKCYVKHSLPIEGFLSYKTWITGSTTIIVAQKFKGYEKSTEESISQKSPPANEVFPPLRSCFHEKQAL